MKFWISKYIFKISEFCRICHFAVLHSLTVSCPLTTNVQFLMPAWPFVFRYPMSNHQGIARTQSPTNKNYALELPTFGVIVGVSPTEVQWKGLTLEEPPSWSRLTSVPGKYEEGCGSRSSHPGTVCHAFVRSLFLPFTMCLLK